MVRISSVQLPANPGVVVFSITGADVEPQWTVKEVLQNICRTKSDDKLRVFYQTYKEAAEDYHFRLFPGQPLPGILLSKHEATKQGIKQPVFLKPKTVPTTMVFAWMTWAFSNGNRSAEDRAKAFGLLSSLWNHSLKQAGSIELDVANVVTGVRTPHKFGPLRPWVPGTHVWTRILAGRLRPKWDRLRLSGTYITSDFQRPSFLDLVFFGMDPLAGHEGSLVRPVAMLLLASFATWLNDPENLVPLSIEDVSFQDAKAKTRLVEKQARLVMLMQAAFFYINENATWMQFAQCERMPCVATVVLSIFAEDDSGLTLRKCLDKFGMVNTKPNTLAWTAIAARL
eukprot:s155_g2.t1